MLKRHKNEVLLKPEDFKPSHSDLKVIGVFNPGVCLYDGEVILLVRVAEAPQQKEDGYVFSPRIKISDGKPAYHIQKFRTKEDPHGEVIVEGGHTCLPHISHFKIVRLTRDGYKVKSIEDHPQLIGLNEYEICGIEDPRITQIGDDYYISYVGVSEKMNVSTHLMVSKDFKNFDRKGVIFPCENKDVVFFPEKVNDKHFAMHRPVPKMKFTEPSMVSATSPNMTHWGEHQSFMLSGKPPSWDSVRIGAGTPPIRTKKGWLQIYHGVCGKAEERKYSAGCVLSALDDPNKVIARSKEPILEPVMDYEINGYISRVVFPTGWVPDPTDPDKMIVYYGCADTDIAAVTLSISEMLESLLT